MDDLLLVNENDEIIGYGEKLDVHKRELLHRAFSIFIVDLKRKEILLQKRAEGKYHSGGLWTNACCSHPRKGETWNEALQNRLEEELHMKVSLDIEEPSNPLLNYHIYKTGKFTYFAPFDGLSEHEIDHVFVYPVEKDFIDLTDFNPEEISELRWIRFEQLDKALKETPKKFTAWFEKAYVLAQKLF